MTKWDIAQIAGVALVVLGGQGAVRLLFNQADGGLLSWLPGGFVVWIVAQVVAIGVGAALATWARARSRDARDRN